MTSPTTKVMSGFAIPLAAAAAAPTAISAASAQSANANSRRSGTRAPAAAAPRPLPWPSPPADLPPLLATLDVVSPLGRAPSLMVSALLAFLDSFSLTGWVSVKYDSRQCAERTLKDTTTLRPCESSALAVHKNRLRRYATVCNRLRFVVKNVQWSQKKFERNKIKLLVMVANDCAGSTMILIFFINKNYTFIFLIYDTNTYVLNYGTTFYFVVTCLLLKKF